MVNANGEADSGQAQLNIDFGADTASLALENGYKFNLNPQFSNTGLTIESEDTGYGAGSADGEFQESTGNTVTGNYSQPDSGGTASGTYDVTSSQTLN